MSTTQPARLAILATVAVVSLAVAGCQVVDQPTAHSGDRDSETSQQSLGESRTSYRLDGVGAGILPKYNERVAVHLMNRIRMNPFDEFNLTIPMSEQPLPAQPPARYSYIGSEAMRWHSRYLLQNECDTPCDADGNPMTPPQFRTCCQIALRQGKFTCTPPEGVECTSSEAMSQDARMDVFESAGLPNFNGDLSGGATLGPEDALQQLPGELIAANLLGNVATSIASNQASSFGFAAINIPNVPDMCDPQDPCDRGTCQNAQGERFCNPDDNPECDGLCKGGPCDGTCTEEIQGEESPVTCTLPERPDPEQCQPENYGRSYRYSFAQLSSNLPRPTLMSGIHLKLGRAQDQPFGSSGALETQFAVHYFEPAGPAESAQVVVDGQCHSLSTRFEPESGIVGTPDVGGTDAGELEPSYYGNTYTTSLELESGCHPYYFSFVDGEGIQQTYPSYGTLTACIGEGSSDGSTVRQPIPNETVENAEQNAIWTAGRSNPNPSCLPQADECQDGETRTCYTGTAQTRGVGACTVGTETCVNGRWNGVCEGQTLPADDDTCGDGIDNDCNGYVDDNCQGVDVGVSTDTGTNDGLTPGGDDGGGGCSTTQNSLPTAPLAAMILAVGVAAVRRRSFQ